MELNSPSALLAGSPLDFLTPSKQLSNTFLAAAAQYLSPIAATITEEQAVRRENQRKKRKRGEYDEEPKNILRLKKVHYEGFSAQQVFQQAVKVVDAALEQIEHSLPRDNEAEEKAVEGEEAADEVGDAGEFEDEDDEDDEDEGGYTSLGEEGIDWEYDGDDVSDDEAALNGTDEGAGMSDIDGDTTDDNAGNAPAATYRSDPHGINDPFFDIDEFNKQSEFLEQQDMRGEGIDDDDEIDYDMDPFTATTREGRDGGMADDESEAGGPTFGNMDLNAPEGDSDDHDELEEGDMDGAMDGSNANNIMYADFFAPPAKKQSKSRKRRSDPHKLPSGVGSKKEGPGDDMEATMSRVHRDLFSDDDDAEESDMALDPADPKSRQSTYQRRQAKIMEQIRKLEAANVSRRQWQLAGEVTAADRPENALLEENLDFERAGKPTPVITAEISEDIEAMIKRRILAQEFDTIQRRRPDDLATGPKVRRGEFHLDDTKAEKGLAEIYEQELLSKTDPNYVSARDEKLQKEHAEIEVLWKSISAKLDSLSSSHFKPKRPAANIEIRVAAPAIEMEDARPTAGGDVAAASMLAPQELYKPGEEKPQSEVVTKGGMPVAREEMSREEKQRRRRREKERIKKANLHQPVKDESAGEKKKQEKKQLLGDLKKGGVQVIGKKGQLTDVEGRDVKEAARKGVGSFKL